MNRREPINEGGDVSVFSKVMIGVAVVLALLLAVSSAPVEVYVVFGVLLAVIYGAGYAFRRALRLSRERTEGRHDAAQGITRADTQAAAAPPRETTGSRGLAVDGAMGKDGEWHPSQPAGTVVEAWVPAWGQIEVAGEAYRGASFASLFRNVRDFRSDCGAEFEDVALLGDDRANPYGQGRAISVWVRDKHVGYIPDSNTQAWYPVVAGLNAKGYVLGVPARVWAVQRQGEPVRARVSLAMGEPSLVFPANEMPENAALIPSGGRYQVTKEDDHLDVLKKWVNGNSAGTAVAFTLHAITEIRPRSAPELVEVRIDGERVGVLSGVTSNNLLPLVKYIEARGWAPTARGPVKGSSLKADVEITAIKAQEADEAWLKSLGDAVPVTVHNTRPDDEWDDEGVPTSASGQGL